MNLTTALLWIRCRAYSTLRPLPAFYNIRKLNLRVGSHGSRNELNFGIQSALYLCSDKLKRNETQNGMNFISVILTEMKFQIGMRFPCEHNLPETKWINADSLDVAFNAHVRLKLNAGLGHFDRNEISFRVIMDVHDVIKYRLNNTRNEMPTHAHIGSFWNAAEMKLHVWTELIFTPVWNLKLVWIHFTSLLNVLLIQKMDISRTAWINLWYVSHAHTFAHA